MLNKTKMHPSINITILKKNVSKDSNVKLLKQQLVQAVTVIKSHFSKLSVNLEDLSYTMNLRNIAMACIIFVRLIQMVRRSRSSCKRDTIRVQKQTPL